MKLPQDPDSQSESPVPSAEGQAASGCGTKAETSSSNSGCLWLFTSALVLVLGFFILVVVVLPSMRTQTEIMGMYIIVNHCEEARVAAVNGNVSEASSRLKDVVEDDSSKLPPEGRLRWIAERFRAATVREIIARMRTLTGEDLGDDPQLWINKYYRYGGERSVSPK